MKIFSKLFGLATLLLLSVACNKNTDPLFIGTALVTFKPQADGSFFIREDENTAYRVLNQEWAKYPYPDGKEKRAIIMFSTDLKQSSIKPAGAEKFDKIYDITLTQVDTLLIRTTVPCVEDNDKAYGNDYFDLILDKGYMFYTGIEDGYLNIFGNISATDIKTKHDIYLVTGTDPTNPYVLEIRHNAFGDTPEGGTIFNAFFNFSLKNLPDTEGKTVKLKLVWNSLTTHKKESAEFDYVSRTDW